MSDSFFTELRNKLDASNIDDLWSKLSKQSRNYYKKRYNLDRQAYNLLQASECNICGLKQEDSKKIFHVDHCHITDMVRGILCRSCNTGLGFFKDNSAILDNAKKYIKRYENELYHQNRLSDYQKGYDKKYNLKKHSKKFKHYNT